MYEKFQFLTSVASTLAAGKGLEDAAGYSGHSDLQWTAAKRMIDTFDWTISHKILDVGCGDGKITAYIADHNPATVVVGADISKSMIRFATTTFTAENHANLLFLRADAAHLPFKQQFDTVVSFSALHWVIAQNNALESIYRALVPGGRVCIVTLGLSTMTKNSENLIASQKWSRHFPNYKPPRVYYSPEDYHDLMKKAGFVDVTVEPQWTRSVHSDRDALERFISPLLTFTAHLSPDLRQEFLSNVVDNIMSYSKHDADGHVIYESLFLDVSAKK